MAIVKNFWLVNQTKKLAGAVIYQAMGQTRSRELAASVSNPRTEAQMQQRVKWANLVNFYRANASWMKFAYETKKTNQSEYNKFMSLNVTKSGIYIPKQLANQGACIVDAYTMTQGSLASIEITPSAGQWITNIFLGVDGYLSQNMTIGEFSQMVVANNPAIREGDQLSFIRFTQLTNQSSGVPYVVVRKYEVIINSSDARMFFEFMPFDYIVEGFGDTQVCVAVNDSGNAGGFLMVLSRTIGGKTYVSTQDIIVANNDAIISQYSSGAALQTAINSYGESSEPFLTSTSAEDNNQASVPTSMVSVKIDDIAYPLGQVAHLTTLTQDASIEARLSSVPESSTISSMTLTYLSGGSRTVATVTGAAISEGVVTAALDAGQDIDNVYLEDLTVVIGGVGYRGVWAVPNSATIVGLE